MDRCGAAGGVDTRGQPKKIGSTSFSQEDYLGSSIGLKQHVRVRARALLFHLFTCLVSLQEDLAHRDTWNDLAQRLEEDVTRPDDRDGAHAVYGGQRQAGALPARRRHRVWHHRVDAREALLREQTHEAVRVYGVLPVVCVCVCVCDKSGVVAVGWAWLVARRVRVCDM